MRKSTLTVLLVAVLGVSTIAVGFVPGGVAAQTGEDEAASELKVTVLNVGQGEAAIFETPNETMVVDTGPWQGDGQEVIDYLDQQGINHVDHLVATHPHSDHIGGHAEVINHLENNSNGVGAVYDSGQTATSGTFDDYISATETHNITVNTLRENDTIPFNGTNTTVLGPVSEPEGNNGIVLKIQHDATTWLWTGDVERTQEERLANSYNFTVDVMSAGHHGSNTSNSEALLKQFEPDAAVISAGYGNSHGHPELDTRERFRDYDVATTWTATHGTQQLVSNGEEIDVYAQNANATINPMNVTDPDEIGVEPTAKIGELSYVMTVPDNTLLPPVVGGVGDAGESLKQWLQNPLEDPPVPLKGVVAVVAIIAVAAVGSYD